MAALSEQTSCRADRQTREWKLATMGRLWSTTPLAADEDQHAPPTSGINKPTPWLKSGLLEFKKAQSEKSTAAAGNIFCPSLHCAAAHCPNNLQQKNRPSRFLFYRILKRTQVCFEAPGCFKTDLTFDFRGKHPPLPHAPFASPLSSKRCAHEYFSVDEEPNVLKSLLIWEACSA